MWLIAIGKQRFHFHPDFTEGSAHILSSLDLKAMFGIEKQMNSSFLQIN